MDPAEFPRCEPKTVTDTDPVEGKLVRTPEDREGWFTEKRECSDPTLLFDPVTTAELAAENLDPAATFEASTVEDTHSVDWAGDADNFI